MYTIFLLGGIGSGKSSAARWLAEHGCVRIDLDALSREVLVAGSPTTLAIAETFGADLLDVQTGELNRALLAQRAFATSETTALLESLELPAIRALLEERLAELMATTQLCVVEIPLPDRMEEGLALADEIVAVCCPLELRRVRAVARGMSAEDFNARAAQQPSETWLCSHAHTVWDNTGTQEELYQQVAHWFETHERQGWQ